MRTILKKTGILRALLAGVMLLAMILAISGCARAGKQLEIALVVADNFGDASFYDSARAGTERLQKEGVASVQYVECGGADYDAKLREAAQSAEMVLAVGWQFENIGYIAAEYPDVKFVWADGTLPEPPENLLCVTYAQNEGAFLAGYLAASLSETGKIGMVGGQEGGVMQDFATGYRQGAAYANADCGVQVVYTGSFQDAAAAKAEALSLSDRDCDVVFHAAGAAGAGVFEAAAEAEFYAIGVDSDQKHLDEEHIVASVVKDIGGTLYGQVTGAASGAWKGGRIWRADLKSGYLGLGYGSEGSQQQVSDALKSEIEQIAGQIKSSEILVESALDGQSAG